MAVYGGGGRGGVMMGGLVVEDGGELKAPEPHSTICLLAPPTNKLTN